MKSKAFSKSNYITLATGILKVCSIVILKSVDHVYAFPEARLLQ